MQGIMVTFGLILVSEAIRAISTAILLLGLVQLKVILRVEFLRLLGATLAYKRLSIWMERMPVAFEFVLVSKATPAVSTAIPLSMLVEIPSDCRLKVHRVVGTTSAKPWVCS